MRLTRDSHTKRNLTEPDIRDFWEVRHRLSNDQGLVLMDRRIVIPKPLRKKILHCLHSAHQGVDGMKARANDSVYWPGMNASIRNFRANCSFCTTIAPSQPREPITMTPSPEWPFQQIVMDIFHVGHVTYLACADRLTGWLILYHLKPGHATTSKLMSICRQLFQMYGTPEEISTDGGQPFTSSCIPGIPSDMGRKAQTILGRISPIQWPCRASSKNRKEDSQWEHRHSRFPGQWQGRSGHLAV